MYKINRTPKKEKKSGWSEWGIASAWVRKKNKFSRCKMNQEKIFRVTHRERRTNFFSLLMRSRRLLLLWPVQLAVTLNFPLSSSLLSIWMVKHKKNRKKKIHLLKLGKELFQDVLRIQFNRDCKDVLNFFPCDGDCGGCCLCHFFFYTLEDEKWRRIDSIHTWLELHTVHFVVNKGREEKQCFKSQVWS